MLDDPLLNGYFEDIPVKQPCSRSWMRRADVVRL
jgi:hypothetical protein